MSISIKIIFQSIPHKKIELWILLILLMLIIHFRIWLRFPGSESSNIEYWHCTFCFAFLTIILKCKENENLHMSWTKVRVYTYSNLVTLFLSHIRFLKKDQLFFTEYLRVFAPYCRRWLRGVSPRYPALVVVVALWNGSSRHFFLITKFCYQEIKRIIKN